MPSYGLAIEEHFLKNLDGQYIMIWGSESSVVVGKHQNALAEVDFPYVYKNNIPVIRRLSGGGTVFHGPGNINFSFILEGKPGTLVDFKKYTQPVISFLNSLGLPAVFEGKNDIRIRGLKVSGNAEHVYRNRVLHHGTLLYDADLKTLNASINARHGRYNDKGVKSVRSRVANVASFLGNAPGLNTFRKMLISYLEDHFNAGPALRLSEADLRTIKDLIDKKYSRWEWNYGYSPDYTFSGSAGGVEGEPSLELSVKRGVIESARIGGKSLAPEWHKLSGELEGGAHCPERIMELLKRHGISRGDSASIDKKLLPLFF